ncbi:MAG: TRAP transporter small permease [Planctomycetota bacterium]
MMAPIQCFRSMNAYFARLLEYLTISVMAVLVLDVAWGVVTRHAFGEQAKWTEELARFLLIWVSIGGGALAFRRKEHLGIDFLVLGMHAEVRRSMAMLSHFLVCFAAVAVMAWGGSVLVRDAFVMQQTTPALGWMMGYVYAIVPIAGLFIASFAIEDILLLWKANTTTEITNPADVVAGRIRREGSPGDPSGDGGETTPRLTETDDDTAPDGDS